MDQRLASYLAEQKLLVDSAIDRLVPPEDFEPEILHQAMRYSLFAGGKRIRPILAMIAAEVVGGNVDCVWPVAVAIECIHTYSLIHDDLPAMDNDDLRRGKPTAHKVYGEATAILAGDALLNLAFEIMVSESALRICRHDRLLRVIHRLSNATGSQGLIAGQVVDMLSEGRKADLKQIDFIMRKKTARLISASLECGAIISGGSEQDIRVLALFGQKLGVAFQIRDDILDLEGNSSELGKSVGKDRDRGKATYPGAVGILQSKQMMKDEIDSALKLLDAFGDRALALKLMAAYIGERSN